MVYAVALPLKGNEFQANHNIITMRHFNRQAVALPLKGNEFQANHNKLMLAKMRLHAVALPLKGNEFQANHNLTFSDFGILGAVALPLKGNEFQANHNVCPWHDERRGLLLYLSKVTNFKQITTSPAGRTAERCCCFTSQR